MSETFRRGQLVRVTRNGIPRLVGKLGIISYVYDDSWQAVVYFCGDSYRIPFDHLELIMDTPNIGRSRCRECGCEFINDIYYFIDTNQVDLCSQCFAKHYYRCIFCRQFIPKDQVVVDPNGYIACLNCHDDLGEDCAHCRNRFNTRLHRTIDHGNLCNDCLRRFPFVKQCSGCGRYITNRESAILDEDYDGEVAYYCFECRHHISPIRQYYYKPLPKFKFTEDEADEEYKLFLGVELEVDDGGNRNSAARKVKEILPFVYCKNDGSLNDGFEIVTHPCTLKYHLQQPYNEAFQYLIEEGYRSGDTRTCGLHIHINRDFFGRSTITQEYEEAKLLYLMEKYWQKMVIFSRRQQDELNDWARRAEDYDPEDSMLENLYKAKGKGRYFALNFENERTIEFRLFKGTLNLKTFFATLQLVDVFTKYAKNHFPEELQELNWEDIFKDCLYPELKGYLFNRKLLKEEVMLCA